MTTTVDPTQSKQPLDLRTLVLLMVEHEDQIPAEGVMSIIAEEVNVPLERLQVAITSVQGHKSILYKQGSLKQAEATSKASEDKPVRHYSRWEQDRLDELVRRWNGGEKPSHIAKAMGVSTPTVYQKISHLRKTSDNIKIRHSKNPAFTAKSPTQN
jgi:hypothetical protein